MALQYYSITGTGEKYALDKSTGKVTKVASIPSGAPTVVWAGAGLPPELASSGATPAAPKFFGDYGGTTDVGKTNNNPQPYKTITPPSSDPAITSNSSIQDIEKYVESVIEAVIGSGKTIDPGLTDEDIAAIDPQRFLAEAEASISPYYQQRFTEVKDNLVRTLTNIGYDFNLQKESAQREADATILQGTEDLAGRGLAFSSNRSKFESDVSDARTRAITAAETKALRDAQDVGTKSESLIGTDALRGISSPSINGRTPFEFSSSPITGSLTSERKYSAESIARELAGQEAQRRAYTTRSLSFS